MSPPGRPKGESFERQREDRPVNLSTPTSAARRRFLRGAAALAACGLCAPALAAIGDSPETGAATGPHRLQLEHLHTGESIDVVYAIDGEYLAEPLAALNHLLRDHRSGEVGVIAPALFDQLHRLQRLVAGTRPFHVVSAFRAAATNARLRAQRGAAVARHSLHLEGRAIDVRLPGVPLATLHRAALSMGAGGVGFYPRARFLHLDTGAVRRW